MGGFMGGLLRTSVAVAWLVVLGAGCSLVVSTDGYAGERPDASAAVGDGGVTDAGGGDAGGADGSATARFCDTLSPDKKIVCEDFDSPSALVGWVRDGEAVEIDRSAAVSPPASMLAKIAPLAAGEKSRSLAFYDTTPRSRLRASWSMLRESSSQCTGLNLNSLYFASPAGYFVVHAQLRADGRLGFQEYGIPGPSTPDYSNGPSSTGPVVLDRWVRLAVTLDFTGAKPKASMTVDGVAQPWLTDFELVGGGNLGTLKEMAYRAGITYIDGVSAECRVRFDDVALEEL